MVGGAEGGVVVYCPGQSVGERLQRIVQQPHEGGVCGPGSFRFVTGGQGFGSGIPAVLESGEVAQRDRVQNAGRIRRRTWAGLRYAPSAPSSITKPTDSHKHWYIKRGQARMCGPITQLPFSCGNNPNPNCSTTIWHFKLSITGNAWPITAIGQMPREHPGQK